MFASDYGLDDEFVGICHSVIARITPTTQVVDLRHGLRPGDVLRAAIVLADSAPYLPGNAILLAVVDPGVGTARRAVAVEAASELALVGPDNGLLSLAWEELGGAVRAVEISSPGVLLDPVSATFHGRDVFAPAAAHLASGSRLEDLGPPLPVRTLAGLEVPEPGIRPGEIRCEVLDVDRFGNVQLLAKEEHLEAAGLAGADALEVKGPSRSAIAHCGMTFGDVGEGEFALIVDSRGWLAVVQREASAAEWLSAATGDRIVIRSPVSLR